MAKVEMDMSEYEALKKVEKTLEESLAREQELGKELAVSQKKEVDALKANEKSVTIITEHRTHQMLQQRQPDHVINSHIEARILQYFDYMMNGNNSSFYQPGRHTSHRMRFELARNMSSMGVDAGSIANMFFTTSESEILNQDGKYPTTITHKGLDQVKEDLRLEAVEAAESNVKSKLASIPTLKQEAKDAKDKLKLAQQKNVDNEAMLRENDELIGEMEVAANELANKLKLSEELNCKNEEATRQRLATIALLGDVPFGKRGKVIKELKVIWKTQ